jgi:signal peptidase
MRLSAIRIATLRRVCDSLLIALIVVVLFGVVLGRIVPMTGRTTLIVGGGSMAPAIPLGAAVIVDPVAQHDIAVGDVVSLRSGPVKAVFTHRVTRVVSATDGVWVETKGDANPSIDPSLTPATSVIGRVSVTIPYAGFLVALLSIPSGVIFVVFLAGVLLTLTWLLESFEIDVATRDARLTQAAGATASIAPRGTLRMARARRFRHIRHVTTGAAGRGD